MNILVPDSWLREFLKTKATPKEIATNLSLCSQSVEKTIPVEGDFIYDIEITTNRPDCLAIYSLARELSAILPRFNLPAKLEPATSFKNPVVKPKNNLPLGVKITNPKLCPRFTALIFDHVKIGPSPKIVQDRLIKAGIRALNNVVDISNYLMLELNQPMHTFDYDKIARAKMVLRESREKEKIATLDGQNRHLPTGTIVIEDGAGRLIDLCGIMGGLNSAVDEKTQRVLLFVQSYDPVKIRRTCQLLGFRTEAAARFEKGIDAEGVPLAMARATQMFLQNCQGRIASEMFDIYPDKPQAKTVKLNFDQLNQIMGLKIAPKEAQKILESLGFKTTINQQTISSLVPHWRAGDVSIPEDLVEEIARIYGYFNLPSLLPAGQIPVGKNNPFFEQVTKIKRILKDWGFTETYNYSLVSAGQLEVFGLNPDQFLKVANPLSEDLTYLRPTLLPSLLEVLVKNQSEFAQIQIFELANLYLPQGRGHLPAEKPFLAMALTNTDFEKSKGLVEALLSEFGLDQAQFSEMTPVDEPWSKGFSGSQTAFFSFQKKLLGIVGQVEPTLATGLGLKETTFAAVIDFAALIKDADKLKNYQPIPKYPAIIEDFSFQIPPRTKIGPLLATIKTLDPQIAQTQLVDSYQNTRTIRVTFSSREKTLTDKEIKQVRTKIINHVATQYQAKLKTV